MSYILNALRKSEQERHNSQAETLENRIEISQGRVKKPTSAWLIVLVIVNLFFLSYFIWSFGKADNPKTINKVITPKPIKSVKPLAKTTLINKVITSVDPIIETVKVTPQHSIAEQIQSNRSKTKTTAKISKAELDQAIQVEKQKNKAIAFTPVVTKANKAIAKTNTAEYLANDVPFLSTLDYTFRRTVPFIDINVYVYAEKKPDRFIMIEMKKYFSGQEISPGMTLKEIRINSLVVEYKGRTFQIKRN